MFFMEVDMDFLCISFLERFVFMAYLPVVLEQ